MPFITTKPIVLVCGSRNLQNVCLSRYLNPIEIGSIVSGGAIGIDREAKWWAINNKIEYIEYKPNYKLYGEKAPLIRDREMAEFCDKVIAFWDGKSKGTKYTVDYASKIGRDVELFIIEDR